MDLIDPSLVEQLQMAKDCCSHGKPTSTLQVRLLLLHCLLRSHTRKEAEYRLPHRG